MFRCLWLKHGFDFCIKKKLNFFKNDLLAKLIGNFCFQVPWVPFVPALSILFNWYLCTQMSGFVFGLCFGWIALGKYNKLFSNRSINVPTVVQYQGPDSALTFLTKEMHRYYRNYEYKVEEGG